MDSKPINLKSENNSMFNLNAQYSLGYFYTIERRFKK